MHKADYLLRSMKQRVDALTASDDKLQQFLAWVNQKALSVNAPYKLAAVRASCYRFELECIYNLAFALDLTHNTLDLELDYIHDISYKYGYFSGNMAIIIDPECGHALTSWLDSVFGTTLDIELRLLVDKIKNQFIYLDKKFVNMHEISVAEANRLSWKANGQVWVKQLRVFMTKHRSNIDHDWQFSEQQIELLQQYYDANKLLVDCLNSGCDVSDEVRQKIEDTLLLPLTEIEKGINNI